MHIDDGKLPHAQGFVFQFPVGMHQAEGLEFSVKFMHIVHLNVATGIFGVDFIICFPEVDFDLVPGSDAVLVIIKAFG